MFDRFRLIHRRRAGILVMMILALTGCATMGEFTASSPLAPSYPADAVERNDFAVAGDEGVIGRLAMVRTRKGDTLPDIARHFSLGINTVRAANPGVDTWVPDPRSPVLLPMRFVLPDAPRNGIVVNLAAMRLFRYQNEGGRLAVSTYPVGVGTAETPTPMGEMVVTRKKHRPTWYVPASIAEDHRRKGDPLPPRVPPGPQNPLGDHALYLNAAGYLIHGTNKPASIGLRATNGCIRLYPEDIARLFEQTPVKTPVRIVDQPYLVGRRDGILFLEAHPPVEVSEPARLGKLVARLKRIEADSGDALDWVRIQTVVAEARGVPVPISAIDHRRERALMEPVPLRHPGRLTGQPEVPAFRADAWYVLAASLPDMDDALRLAAIINHQGPPIPARVLSEGDRHRVLAGPFDNPGAARDAANHLRIYLELDAVVFET